MANATRPGRDDEGGSEQVAYEELQCYTLAHGGPGFIHQHVVDAWAAQHADEQTPRIGLTFALVGLYLHVGRGWSGRQVQRLHMLLGQHKHDWPAFPLPPDRGSVTVRQVMAASPGPDRDCAIDAWCASVWAAFHDSHDTVLDLLERQGV